MNDQNKKTLRQFQCRDYLWEIFEQMSGELECSVDYLINESMRQYARSRNYGARPSPTPEPAAPRARHEQPMPGGPSAPRIPSQPAIPSAPPPRGPGAYPAPAYPAPPARSSPGGYAAAPQPPTYGSGYGQPPQGGYPAPPSYPAPPPGYPAPPPARPAAASSFPPVQTTRPASMQGGAPAREFSSAPPPLPTGAQGGHQAHAPNAHPQGMPTLFVIFNGQKFPVNKDEFIIGRGTKTADLAIKDGNISRRHAAIIFQNGGFYMKDLGSTNGVEYQGRRVDGRRIEEGDVYQLCDYELRFTYR